MSKARGLADLGNVYNDGALSNRNLIINGAMQVAQRGTSAAGVGPSNGYYTCDRWQYRNGSAGTGQEATHEQSTDGPSGFSNSYKISCTVADATPLGSENELLGYKVEGYSTQQLSYGTSAAKTVTLSFWVKSTVTGTYGIQFFNGSSYSALKSYSVNSASTWEYKTILLDGDTVNALPTGNLQSFTVNFNLACGPDDQTTEYEWTNETGFRSVTGQANVFATTSDTWQITGVQLEVGDTATPFEHRSFGQELALCQRYYQQRGEADIVVADGYATGTTTAQILIELTTSMRASPTFALSSVGGFRLKNATGGSSSFTTAALFASSTQVAYLNISGATGIAAGNATMLRAIGVGHYLSLDAEL